MLDFTKKYDLQLIHNLTNLPKPTEIFRIDIKNKIKQTYFIKIFLILQFVTRAWTKFFLNYKLNSFRNMTGTKTI